MSHPSSPSDYLGLIGRVAVVTGGGSGIGRAIAGVLAAQGARVVVLDRSAEGAQTTVADITKAGGQALAIVCDVSQRASVVVAAARSAAHFGPAEVLVNGAGILRTGPLATLSDEDWNANINVNLGGCFLCSQVFGAQMLAQRRGTLVHIASIASYQATAGAGSYSVSKAGIAMLSAQLALEWGAQGIRSNVVNPGMTRTAMTQARYDLPGNTERMGAAIPVGRIAQPQDIAEAVLFLASERSAYITGQELNVDGGFSRMLMSLLPRGDY
jgi:NAD(P)-dependent dehydrogenase (short-subunit alcohol dehydrogenase family)